MRDDYTAPRSLRLLAATLATHDAFTRAAHAVQAPGYAAEFAQRAEFQWRIATHLRGRQAPAGLASDGLCRIPDVLGRSPAMEGADPRVLLGKCLRFMDAATLEFCRGYGPDVAHILSSAMQEAHPVSTTSHGGPAMGD